MISDRDRRILADIEREMRAHDPELCERLSGPAPLSGGALRLLRGLTSTTAIVCYALALVVALVLALPLAALLLLGVLVASVTQRLLGASGDEVPGPAGRPPPDTPPSGPFPYGPFGPPPFGGPPPPFGPR